MHIVIGKHEHVGKLLRGCRNQREGAERKQFVRRFPRNAILRSLRHTFAEERRAAVPRGDLCVRVNQMQVTPTDAHVIPRFVQNVLLRRADPRVSVLDVVDKVLSLFVTAEIAGSVNVHFKGMSFLNGDNLIKHIGNRAGHHLGAIAEERREEGHRQVAERVRESINRRGRVDRHRGLLQCRTVCKVAFKRVGLPHEAVGHAVYGEHAEHGLSAPRPMAGAIVGESVGKAPDAEKRIRRHQRDCSRTKSVHCFLSFHFRLLRLFSYTPIIPHLPPQWNGVFPH